MKIEVRIEDEQLRRRIALVTSPETMRRLNKKIGETVLENTKNFLDDMARDRHKVADRLGAPHSRFLENASGRVAGSPLGQTTELTEVTESGATIMIKNTPGLSRAWQDLHITPKRAGALTIPIDRVAYNRRVADLRRDGHEIFRPKGTNILAERRNRGKLRPIYALVKSVTVPKDPGLLPSKEELREWTEDVAETFFAVRD